MNLSKLTVSPANIIGRIVVAVALAPPASAALAEPGNDIVTTRTDQDIDQPCYTHVTPSASTQVGLFTVHQRCGHVLYEMPPASACSLTKTRKLLVTYLRLDKPATDVLAVPPSEEAS